MSGKQLPRHWLLYWSVSSQFGNLDSTIMRAAANAALSAGYKDSELVAISIEEDARIDGAISILQTLFARLGIPVLSEESICEIIAKRHLLKERKSKKLGPKQLLDFQRAASLTPIESQTHSID